MSGLHNALITYKNRAMQEIIHDPDIVKALNPDATDSEELLYHNIFPFFRVPITDTETLSYITVCAGFPDTRYPDDFVRQSYLTICVIIHQSNMQTEFGSTRLDYISAKIDDILNMSTKYGRGKLVLMSSTESSLDEFHRYREMMYVSKETQVADCG
ncbi:MAG TPA: hypothetical protein DCL74_04490 [Succinivibrionaceae bacterium]|nr:hypothetical protein [Succinivibrionaceae bacterium]